MAFPSWCKTSASRLNCGGGREQFNVERSCPSGLSILSISSPWPHSPSIASLENSPGPLTWKQVVTTGVMALCEHLTQAPGHSGGQPHL